MIIVGGVLGLLLALLLIGRFTPGSGAEQLDWRPTRSPEVEVQNEIDDLDQMLEAANRRRRARGEEELTADALHARVAEDVSAAHAQREDYLREQEVADVLEATNRRRRARGLPALDADEFRTGLTPDGPA